MAKKFTAEELDDATASSSSTIDEYLNIKGKPFIRRGRQDIPVVVGRGISSKELKEDKAKAVSIKNLKPRPKKSMLNKFREAFLGSSDN